MAHLLWMLHFTKRPLNSQSLGFHAHPINFVVDFIEILA